MAHDNDAVATFNQPGALKIKESVEQFVVFMQGAFAELIPFLDALETGVSVMLTTWTPSEIETVFFSVLMLLLSNDHYRPIEGFLELTFIEFISSNHIIFTTTTVRLPYELIFFHHGR